MADVKFSLKGQNENATKFVAKTRQFEIIIDEPDAFGGADEAPNPVEFLLAAYAGCLNVMGHLIAKELGIQLNGLEIELSGNLDPSKLFGQEKSERAGYKGIEVIITPDTGADEATLKLWLETIEKRCPVNDNLVNPTPVKIAVQKKKAA